MKRGFHFPLAFSPERLAKSNEPTGYPARIYTVGVWGQDLENGAAYPNLINSAG